MDNAELLSEYYRDPPKTERIDGVIYNMAAGSTKHADVIANLIAAMSVYFRGRACKLYTSELEIHLDEDNEFRPDLSVICDFSKMRENGYWGAPTLVIEVLSPSTAKIDRVKKFLHYQESGVREYWLVNPEYETIEQYVLSNGLFKLAAIHLYAVAESDPPNPFRYGTVFCSETFTDLEINLNEAFAWGGA